MIAGDTQASRALARERSCGRGWATGLRQGADSFLYYSFSFFSLFSLFSSPLTSRPAKKLTGPM